MSIETICQSCARKLRVEDQFAGRKARCPHCKHVYTVPQSSERDAVDSSTAGEAWRLRTEDGNVYGPVSKPDLDAWFTEGRITANSSLQREGTTDWVGAAVVFPALNAPTKQAVQASPNPFSDVSGDNANPYSAPTSVGPTMRPRRHRPHRGGLILTLGIIGIACCVVCAPIAWAMGQTDMREIRSGVMDPAGRGLTQAGMVLGIIGTVILAAQIIFGVIGALAG